MIAKQLYAQAVLGVEANVCALCWGSCERPSGQPRPSKNCLNARLLQVVLQAAAQPLTSSVKNLSSLKEWQLRSCYSENWKGVSRSLLKARYMFRLLLRKKASHRLFFLNRNMKSMSSSYSSSVIQTKIR